VRFEKIPKPKKNKELPGKNSLKNVKTSGYLRWSGMCTVSHSHKRIVNDWLKCCCGTMISADARASQLSFANKQHPKAFCTGLQKDSTGDAVANKYISSK